MPELATHNKRTAEAAPLPYNLAPAVAGDVAVHLLLVDVVPDIIHLGSTTILEDDRLTLTRYGSHVEGSKLLVAVGLDEGDSDQDPSWSLKIRSQQGEQYPLSMRSLSSTVR